MTKESIFELVKVQITKVLPSLSKDKIEMERSLEEIGADSIDRSDIYTGMVDKLGLEIPLVKLGEAKTIKSLVDILHEHQNR